MLVYICVSILLLSGMCDTAEYQTIVGVDGQRAQIYCSYPPGKEENDKYFCRLHGFTCEDLIRTNTRNTWVTRGRVALLDNTRARVFTINISALSLEDSGKYWCGVDVSMRPDEITEVRISVKGKPRRQINATGSSPVVEVENSTSPVTVQKTEDGSAPAGGERQSHFRFLSVISMVCVGMLLFVCVFSLIHLLRRINSCSLSVSASYHIREKPNSGLAEDDYVRMKPGVRQVTSPVEEHPSNLHPLHTGAAVNNMNVPEIDPYYLDPIRAASSGPDPDYIDLSAPRLSRVYQNLREESMEESVYHTIDVCIS
uniref:CMRF35-like molecule 2 n=1 Tax=Astyanax mexicanus TaxID=7994 RepID=W5KPW1_ASTMX